MPHSSHPLPRQSFCCSTSTLVRAIWSCGCAILLIAAISGDVAAQVLDEASVIQQLQQQDEEIRWLRQRIEAIDAAQASSSSVNKATLPEPATTALPKVVVDLPKCEDPMKEKWTVKLGGQVFADYGNWASASPAIQPLAQDFFNWRRIRLHVDGKGYGVYDFRVQLDFEPDNDTVNSVAEPYVAMKDVYISINDLPLNGRLRFGNFFVPFSLDQLTPLPNTQFMERSIPTAGVFSPDREVGMAWYHISDDLNKTLSLGVFFDDIPESTKEVVNDNQGLRLSSRATWLPYYDEATDGRYLIHTGLDFLYTDPRTDTARFRARPGEIRETQRLIDTGLIPANSFSVAGLELATVTGPFSLQSELYATSVDRIQTSDVMLYGGYFQGSYFLTGENRKYDRDGRHLAHFGRIVPYSTFFITPGGCGWGAWEAKARWAFLDFSELNRGQYNELTVGMNWYWHENARVMFEWIHPWTSSEARVGNVLIGATTADLLAIRMQYTF